MADIQLKDSPTFRTLAIDTDLGDDLVRLDYDEAFAGGPNIMTKGAGRLKIGILAHDGDDFTFGSYRDIEGDSHSHGFRSANRWNGTVLGNAYCDYDAITEAIGGPGAVTCDHWRMFQARNLWNRDGTLSLFNAFASQIRIAQGVVTQAQDYYIMQPDITGGTLGTHFGIYGEALVGASTSVGFFFQNNSYNLGDLTLAGALTGVTAITASGEAKLGAIHSTGAITQYYAGGGVFLTKARGGAAYALLQAYTNNLGATNGLCLNGEGGPVLVNCLVPAVGGFEVAAHVVPHVDNTYNVGTASFRWGTIYAATGTINTSDERLKKNIEAIPGEWLDAWGEVEWCRFIYKEGGKRWHVGLIAQRVHAAFEKHGIDAFEIGLIGLDKWERKETPVQHKVRKERVVKEMKPVPFDHVEVSFRQSEQIIGMQHRIERPVTRHRFEEVETVEVYYEWEETGEVEVIEAGDIWSLRYSECNALEAAWQRRELAALREEIASLRRKK
jgi:hypothetical protein